MGCLIKCQVCNPAFPPDSCLRRNSGAGIFFELVIPSAAISGGTHATKSKPMSSERLLWVR